MGTDTIRTIIASARQHESESGALAGYFSQHIDELQMRLVLPEENAVEGLVEFVEQYIDYVPVFIDSAGELSRQSGIYDYVAPFLHLAEDCFLAPPEEVGGEQGLQALLDESFLAQRLIEEINDRHIRHYQSPLLPIDMTRANVIVHHLLGDELANRLDMLVEQTVARLIDGQRVFATDYFSDLQARMKPNQWQDLPCLSRNADVDLRL